MTVRATHLDEQLQPIGALSGVQVFSSGQYQVQAPIGSIVRVAVSGSFRDELSGELVTLTEPLTGLTRVQPGSQLNINIVTHLIDRYVTGAGANVRKLFDPDLRMAEQQVGGQLGFQEEDNLQTLNLRQIPANAGLDNPNLRLLLLSGGVMTLERSFGAMSPDWQSLGSALEQQPDAEGLAEQFALFSGLEAIELINQMRNSGVVQLPDLDIQGQPEWICEINCGWVEFPTPGLSVVGGGKFEAYGYATVTIRRSGDLSTAIDATLETIVGGTATPGVDYVPILETVHFAENVGQRRVRIPLLIDGVSDSGETIQLRLTSAERVNTPEATVNIVDDEPPGLRRPSPNFIAQQSGLCFVAAGAAADLDPAEQNCIDPIPDLYGLVGETVEVAMRIGVGIHSFCAPEEDCPALNRDWALDLSLEAVPSVNAVAQRQADLGTYAYFGADVARSSDELVDPPRFLASLAAPEVQDVIAFARDNDLQLVLRAVLDADEHSRITLQQIPVLSALSGRITFGDRELLMVPGTVVMDRNPVSCPAGDVALDAFYSTLSEDLSGQAIDPTMLEPDTGAVGLSGGVCVTLQPGVGPVGVAVSQADLDVAGKLFVLPPGQGTALGAGLPGAAVERVLYIGTPQAPRQYTSTRLPFTLPVTGGRLTDRGLEIQVQGLNNLQIRMTAPQDSRVNPRRLASNDLMFRDSAPTTLQVPDSGPVGTLAVTAGEGQLSYPGGSLAWNSYLAELEAGALNGVAEVPLDYQLIQSTACEAAGCLTGTGETYSTSGRVRQDATGRILGVVEATGASRPGFGQKSPNRRAFERPQDFPQGATATLAAPGFLFPAELPVVASLPAHIGASDAALVAHDTRSEAFRLGNHAPAGLSIGPEIYANTNGQPVPGSGRDWIQEGGPITRVDSGGDVVELATGPATKYVLRPSGWTGVFNADSRALNGGLIFSGYEMFLSRFAFRAVDNSLDITTWIDGKFSLPGDAQLNDLVFYGLGLECDGALAGGHLTSEICDGQDANGNGVVDENCPVPLGSWAMTTQVQSLRFTGDGGDDAAACADEPLFATLGQDVTPLAIDAPLSMENGWTPEGTLAFTATRQMADYLMDATASSDGFPVQPVEGALTCLRSDPNDPHSACADGYGWFEGEAFVGLPFWRAVRAGYRWANRRSGLLGDGAPEADTTALLPTAYLNSLESSNADNASLMRDLDANTSAHFAVAYEWGKTGFGFRLPAYYQPPTLGADSIPSFIGVERGRDLIVLEAGAGINYIEPERTRFSFGASADIQQFQEFSFQLNLQDPRAAEFVDDTLIRFGVIQRPLLTPVFARIREPLDLFNQLAGRGLDQIIEEVLILGLERAGERAAAFSPLGEDPLVSLSKALAQLQSLPAQVLAQVRSEVADPLHDTVDRLESDLRAQGRALLMAAADAAADATTGTQPVPDDLLQDLEALAQSARDIADQAREIDARAAEVAEQGGALLDDASAAANRVLQVLPAVSARLQQVTAFSGALCGNTLSGEVDNFLNQIFVQLDGLGLALDIAANTDLLLPLLQLASQDPELNQAIREGQAGVRRAAEELQSKLLTIEGALKDEVCTDRTDELLANAERFLSDLVDLATLADRAVIEVAAELERLDLLRQRANELLVGPLATVEVELRRLAATAREAAIPPTAEEFRDALDALQARAVELERLAVFLPDPNGPDAVNLLIAPEGRRDDLLGYLAGAMRAEVDDVMVALEDQLRDIVDEDLPRLSYTPDELRRLLVGQLMGSQPIHDLRALADQKLTELRYRVNEMVTQVADQVNLVVRGALTRVEDRINQVVEKASAPLKAIPLQSAGLDGFAVIAGEELERVHVGAEWILAPDANGEEPRKFGAALDVVSWSANNKTAGCSIPQGESRLDVMLSAFNLPAAFGPSKVVMKEISMGFTLAQDEEEGLSPKGVFGGLFVQGDIGAAEFIVYDPGLVAGIGDRETYFGARAGAVISTIAVEAAFLAGKTCNRDVLLKLDPNVAQFIPIPDSGFAGAYLRGSASIPVYSNGCPLTIGVAADAGAWVLAGPPLTLGGIIGGGAFGKVGCVGALRGQLRALGTVNTDGEYVFAGEGFGVAGAGLCEPAGWTSVERSREDTLCGTADARIAASFDGSWSLLDLSVSALH